MFIDFSGLRTTADEEKFRNIKVGDKLKFRNETQSYTVRARSDGYIIITKPFNLQKTVLYSILDFDLWAKSTNDRVFNPYDYKNQEDCEKCIADLATGKIEISHRNAVAIKW